MDFHFWFHLFIVIMISSIILPVVIHGKVIFYFYFRFITHSNSTGIASTHCLTLSGRKLLLFSFLGSLCISVRVFFYSAHFTCHFEQVHCTPTLYTCISIPYTHKGTMKKFRRTFMKLWKKLEKLGNRFWKIPEKCSKMWTINKFLKN